MPSLLASFEEPSIEDIINATLTDDEFLALEKAIEEDRKRSVQTGPPKPRPLGPLAPPKAEVDSMIGLLHVCYENEEWSTVAQLSLALLSAGVNWLPYLHARLALASAFLDPLGSAFGHATMSYQNYPDQAPAYIAIALCKLVVNQPHQALRWLRLASKASNLPQRVYQSLQKELKWTIAIDDGRVKRLLPYFKMPSYVQGVMADPSVNSKLTNEALQPILEKLRASGSPLQVALEREANDGFDALVHMAGYRHMPPLFEALDDAPTAQPGSPFKSFTPSIFAHLADFLQPMEVCRVACTCRTMAGWANQEVVWKSICDRFVGVTPSHILHVAHHSQYYKRFIKSFLFVVDICQVVHRGIPYEDELDSAREIIRIFGAPYRRGYPSPFLIFSSVVADRIAEDSTESSALYYARKTSAISIFLALLCRPYTGDTLENETWAMSALTTLVLRAGSEVAEIMDEVGARTILRFFLSGSGVDEACTLLAVLASTRYMEQQTLQPVLPSPKTLSVAPPSEIHRWRSYLSGIWHFVLVKAEHLNQNKFNQGVCKLDFDEELGDAIEGEGVTSIGDFEAFEEIDFSLEAGLINFAISFSSGIRYIFSGQANPMGFGGSFGVMDASCADAIPSSSSSGDSPSMATGNNHLHHGKFGSCEHGLKSGGKIDMAASPDRSSANQGGANPSGFTIVGYWYMAKDTRDCDDDLWEAVSSAMRESCDHTVEKDEELEEALDAAQLERKLQEQRWKQAIFYDAHNMFTLSRPSVSTVQIHYLEAEYADLDPEMSRGMLDILPVAVEKGVTETPKKFARRTTLLAGISGRLLELRMSLASLYLDEFDADLAILEAGPHNDNLWAFRNVFMKWFDRLSLSMHEWYGMPCNPAAFAVFLRQVRNAVSARPQLSLPQSLVLQSAANSFHVEPNDDLSPRDIDLRGSSGLDVTSQSDDSQVSSEDDSHTQKIATFTEHVKKQTQNRTGSSTSHGSLRNSLSTSGRRSKTGTSFGELSNSVVLISALSFAAVASISAFFLGRYMSRPRE